MNATVLLESPETAIKVVKIDEVRSLSLVAWFTAQRILKASDSLVAMLTSIGFARSLADGRAFGSSGNIGSFHPSIETGAGVSS